jgi:hypothetical protein
MMTRFFYPLALVVAFVTGCATRASDYDGVDIAPVSQDAGYVPSVHIVNHHWTAADVFMNGQRLATVGGMDGSRIIKLQAYQISSDGAYTFRVHLGTSGYITLDQVGFLRGKRILVEIQPNGSGSAASLESITGK